MNEALHNLVIRLSHKIETASPAELAKIEHELRNADLETQKALKIILRGMLVSKTPVSILGFGHYYYSKYGWDLPTHHKEWAEAILQAYEEENGVLLEAARGMGKSTVSISVAEYLLGKNPHKSGLITAATETDANAIGKFISDTIEHNPGWKLSFPNIVPDKERGWGEQGGYFLKNTDVPYAEWVQITMKDHQRDPSILAVSISSAVGKHPSLFLFGDDIHTGKNSQGAELKTVKSRFFSDVFPTMNRPKSDEKRPFFVSTFTPWGEEDTNAELKRSGVYRHIKTPLLVFEENGKHEFEGKKCTLLWEEGYDIEKINELRRTNSSSEFARMYLCDLERAKIKVYKYQIYPHEKIDPRWLSGAGVDYATVYAPTRSVEGNRSHYALAVGSKTPMNQIVLKDGFIGQITFADGSEQIRRAQNSAINWRRTGIEANGSGKEFYQFCSLQPDLLVQPRLVGGGGGKEKRQFDVLDRVLSSGVLLISDEDNEFLRVFRNYLDNYPNFSDKKPRELDAADAVVQLIYIFPECLALPNMSKQEYSVLEPRKARTVNPWIGA